MLGNGFYSFIRENCKINNVMAFWGLSFWSDEWITDDYRLQMIIEVWMKDKFAICPKKTL